MSHPPTAFSHQVAIKMIWPHFWQAVMSSIFVHSLLLEPFQVSTSCWQSVVPSVKSLQSVFYPHWASVKFAVLECQSQIVTNQPTGSYISNKILTSLILFTCYQIWDFLIGHKKSKFSKQKHHWQRTFFSLKLCLMSEQQLMEAIIKLLWRFQLHFSFSRQITAKCNGLPPPPGFLRLTLFGVFWCEENSAEVVRNRYCR